MKTLRYRKVVLSPPFNGAEWWESESPDNLEARMNELADHGPHNPFDSVAGIRWFAYGIQIQP